MEWLSQNWIWVIAIIGFVFLMRRGGMGGCGMGHAHNADRGDEHGSSNQASNATIPNGVKEREGP